MQMLPTRVLLIVCLASLTVCQISHHGYFRGYKNSRSWGTGSQGRAQQGGEVERMGRLEGDDNSILASDAPSVKPINCSCSPSEEATGSVCGTDFNTYTSVCHLQSTACTRIRRQGRSFQSALLKLEISYPGPCRSPCAGMEELGQFEVFGSQATNSGLCVHDSFKCARLLRTKAMTDDRVQDCCQQRYELCERLKK
jgi:hypothetical protein